MSGHSPSRWGWHRLADSHARALVASSGVDSRHLILDLGAGDGAVTRHLARTGARVIAFELHAGRASALRRQFPDGGVKVVRADVADLRLPRRPFRVVANPPFGVASSVLSRLTHRSSRLERADLILPHAVAERWGHRLDPTRWRLRTLRSIPRSAFSPRPRIDCCVATIESVGR